MSERWQVIISAAVIAAIAIWLPYYQAETGSLLTQYDYSRVDIWQQPWRILTAHIFHLDATHALYNALGFLLISSLFAHHFTVRTWLSALIIIALACVITVWAIGIPERFVGLSGVIHGMLLTSLLLEWAQKNYQFTDWLPPLTIALLSVKVGLEIPQWLQSTVLLSNGPNFGLIHFGGLVGGLIAWRLHRKKLASITTSQSKPTPTDTGT